MKCGVALCCAVRSGRNSAMNKVKDGIPSITCQNSVASRAGLTVLGRICLRTIARFWDYSISKKSRKVGRAAAIVREVLTSFAYCFFCFSCSRDIPVAWRG